MIVDALLWEVLNFHIESNGMIGFIYTWIISFPEPISDIEIHSNFVDIVKVYCSFYQWILT